MTTDIVLDDEGKERILLAAAVVKTTASDLIMDSPARHKGKPGLRRAMVHDANDGLTLNFNGDYSGGLNLLDAQLRLRIYGQVSSTPILPKRAVAGDLIAIQCFSPASIVAQNLGVTLVGAGGGSGTPEGIDVTGALTGTALGGLAGAADGGIDLTTTLTGVALQGLAGAAAPKGEDITLWLCVRGGARKTAYWREIPLGNTIKGVG